MPDKEDDFPLSSDVERCLPSKIEQNDRLAEVNDVDAIPFAVNKRAHLRIPAAPEMTKMCAGFEELFDCNHSTATLVLNICSGRHHMPDFRSYGRQKHTTPRAW